jgi:glutaredoxin
MRKVTLYTRVGCHLCDDVKLVLDEARKDTPFELEVLDIDRDPALKTLYDVEVPVVAIDGKKAFKYRMTAEQLRERLRRA